ncbi:HAD-IA family hydrolase [Streptomyces sp. V3I7]|uniref:HAD-IA family hydrolase n=1 Tax=Streptomyces sp. V3I7 TaxID=3042278 RepID=UPI00277D8047|nr:HAD-IA family hydrolase [Streptomyces sp. V3I7]MDQ0994263.1 HAD superfamily hydrolase (TIGR01509 family) [Streptomyces sp. V3I7]
MRRPDDAGRTVVVFDVDGTLVDSERDGHRVAFDAAFAAAGLPYRWSVEAYGRLLDVTGGRRRIAVFLEEQEYEPEEASVLAAALHADKTARFRELVAQGRVPARPGVPELIADLQKAGVTLAVATTGTLAWVEPLLERLFGADTFAEVVTGTDVRTLKPDPAVYREVLARLGVGPEQALAVEDSANGLTAALDAGLPCVVVTNDYTRGQDFTGALAVFDGFNDPDAAALLRQSAPWR